MNETYDYSLTHVQVWKLPEQHFTKYYKKYIICVVVRYHEDADSKFWRVQVKTGWLDADNTVIKFATASSYNHTAKQKGWRHYQGQCDYFAVYVEQLDKVYFIPVDVVGVAQAQLRLAPTKNNQEKNVRWAQDYELQ